MKLVFYHRTSRAAANRILQEGFKDRVGRYMTIRRFRGVFVSDRPLDCNEGAKGDVLLEAAFSLSEKAESPQRYFQSRELIEVGKPYREWILAAKFINKRARIREVPFEEEMELPF